MGVQGLWSILKCSGNDIDLSVLEGKILAIDLSIWLNQALKTSNDTPNAHLQILFNRICKLLFYKIKPVFIFDGPTPTIKRYALEIRRKVRQKKNDRTEQIRANIINILMKKNLIERKRTQIKKTKDQNDMFQLSNENSEWLHNWRPNLDSEFTEIATDYISNFRNIDDVDLQSETFLSLPLEVQHEILRTVSKEKRYGLDSSQFSYNDMDSSDFSGLQIQRLLNRNDLHVRVDSLKSTMNDRDCRNVLNNSKLITHTDLSSATVTAKRIISHNSGYLMMIDPVNDDFIKKLSESKREAMLKGIKRSPRDEKTEETSKDNYISVLEESENVLTNQDLTSIMRCVSKLKKNARENAEVLGNCDLSIDGKILVEKEISDNETEVVKENPEESSEEVVMVMENEDSNDVRHLYTDKYNTNESSEEDSNDVGYSCGNKDSQEDIFSTNPVIDVCNSQVTEEQDEPELEDNSESEGDFIDVSDPEEAKSDDIVESELNNTLEQRDLMSSSRDKVDSNCAGFSQSEVREIISDPQGWNSSVEQSLTQLYEQENKLEHQSVPMSEHYFQEAKELLRYFGIPYVESPAEAEAQCAHLENAGLTSGTITEDSDIWLFGAKTVYKHMFTSDVHVRQYTAKNIYKKLGLDRDLMVCVALLSGGDYTPGIYGVGPVNAMEILAEFSDPDLPMTNFQVLETFKKWSTEHKNKEKPYSGNSERKRFLKFELDDNFPDRTVYEAYNKPLVDESLEPFVWSAPANEKLIEYIHTMVGWPKLKIIEMLEVAQRSNSKCPMSQKKITDFFDESPTDYRHIPSKRLKLATRQRNLIAKNLGI